MDAEKSIKNIIKIKDLLKNAAMAGIIFLFCLPVIWLVFSSIQSNQELQMRIAPITQSEDGFAELQSVPIYPTLGHYCKLLLFTPAFYHVLWNSIKMVCGVIIGQVLIAVPSAWAFAHFRFRGRTIVFSIYVILMLLPFQVTMLSQYLVLQRFHLLNTPYSIILPGIFSTFPVFIIYRGFVQLPNELFEAARVDGAGEAEQFFQIGIPIGINGILSAMVLSFLEYWNLCEQPLAFLKDKSLWPLSIYLPEIGFSQIGVAFAAASIVLIPAAFVFFWGQQYLEAGIIASAIKE